MDEQVRIVAELEALQVTLNTAKRLQAETAAELDALLPSILDRAFKGRALSVWLSLLGWESGIA